MPALIKEGYGDRFSIGLLTSAGSLGILIPPSIPMIPLCPCDERFCRRNLHG